MLERTIALYILDAYKNGSIIGPSRHQLSASAVAGSAQWSVRALLSPAHPVFRFVLLYRCLHNITEALTYRANILIVQMCKFCLIECVSTTIYSCIHAEQVL